MRLFIDDSAWLHLLNPKAAYHPEITATFNTALKNNHKLFTHNTAVGAALSNIKNTLGSSVANQFSLTIEEAYTGNHLTILWVGRRTQKEAIRLLREHSELTLDVYDFAAYLLMKRKRINTILSTKPAYKSLGLRVIPDIAQ